MGMELERWTNKSCVADFGVGNNWATLYSIESKEQGKGQLPLHYGYGNLWRK